QNVNRTATQVELRFDVGGSPSLTEAQRALILHRLRGYIDQEGVLHLFSRATASQYQNRQDVRERLCDLLARSLRRPRRRIATRPTRASALARLDHKRRRGTVKRGRGRPPSDE
ncbi:MAG: alternative ribosome rescue aminoacyl-tRNA hydrolase ArfB, partial [Chloroflexota bacterium]